ncbi:hypothetical protein JCM6882_008121 [Rhodosporidiobolus microsporus]
MSSKPSIQLTRPLIDRRRSSSRDRNALHRPSLSRGGSPTASPVGSPPAASPSPLQSILKHPHVHPSDLSASQLNVAGGGGRDSGPASPLPEGVRDSPVGGLEGSVSTLSLASRSAGGGADAGTETSGSASASGFGTAGENSSRTSFESGGTTLASSAAGGAGGAGAGQAPQFRRRVGFDTFDAGNELEGKAKATGGGTGVTYSFTLSAKSSNYCRTKGSRTFLVATDLNEYSVNATDWLLDSFSEDNDEIVVLRVIEPGSSAHERWKASIEEARDEAEDVLEYLMKKNGEEKMISLIVEFAIGPIEETIHRMIEIYKPDSLIVGTRGKPDSLFRSAMMGSISRWAVARSPIPVVVVRPDDKVRETLSRRLQDPKRGRSYVSLLSREEQARLAAHHSATLSALGANGAPLERTVTAPEAGEEAAAGSPASGGGRASIETGGSSSSGGGEKSGGGGGLGSKIGWALGTKDSSGKKKDKGKEFKRFGTFS